MRINIENAEELRATLDIYINETRAYAIARVELDRLTDVIDRANHAEALCAKELHDARLALNRQLDSLCKVHDSSSFHDNLLR
jgi:hypothetical protein